MRIIAWCITNLLKKPSHHHVFPEAWLLLSYAGIALSHKVTEQGRTCATRAMQKPVTDYTTNTTSYENPLVSHPVMQN